MSLGSSSIVSVGTPSDRVMSYTLLIVLKLVSLSCRATCRCVLSAFSVKPPAIITKSSALSPLAKGNFCGLRTAPSIRTIGFILKLSLPYTCRLSLGCKAMVCFLSKMSLREKLTLCLSTLSIVLKRIARLR